MWRVCWPGWCFSIPPSLRWFGSCGAIRLCSVRICRFVLKGLIIAVMVILGAFIGHWAHGAWLNDYTPVQPIEFSHQIHAGENEIPA